MNSQLVFSCYYGSYAVPEDGWYEVSYTGNMLCERLAFGTEVIPITTNDWSVNVDLVWEGQENLERIESMSKEYNPWTRSVGVVAETTVLAANVLLSGATAGAPIALQSISTAASAAYTGSKALKSIVETIDDWQFHNTETITRTTTKYLEAGQTYQWMWGVQTQLSTDTLLEAAVYAAAYTQLSLDSITVTPLFAITHTVTSTHGLNGSIEPAGDSSVEKGGSIPLRAIPDAGYIVDLWYVDGVPYPNSEGLEQLTLSNIQADKFIVVTFKPDDTNPSQIEVAGSTSPDTFEVTIAPGNGKWVEIPVRNVGYSTVTVNCSKSGTAESWASLESTSFTLSSQEIERHKVTINVPDNTSSGIYNLNITYNDIIFPISIRVAASGETYTEPLESSVVCVDGDSSTQQYDFDRSGYDYFDISGKYQTFASTYLQHFRARLSECRNIESGHYCMELRR